MHTNSNGPSASLSRPVMTTSHPRPNKRQPAGNVALHHPFPDRRTRADSKTHVCGQPPPPSGASRLKPLTSWLSCHCWHHLAAISGANTEGSPRIATIRTPGWRHETVDPRWEGRRVAPAHGGRAARTERPKPGTRSLNEPLHGISWPMRVVNWLMPRMKFRVQ